MSASVYGVRADYANVAQGLRADLGFQSKADYKKVVLGGHQTWYGDANASLTQWGYFGDWDKTYDQEGNMLGEEFELFGELEGQMQLYSKFGIIVRKSFYDYQYFDEVQGRSYTRFTPVAGLKLQFFTRFGDQIDYANTQLGDVINFETTLTWDADQHVNVNFSHNLSQLDVDNGRLYTANQYDVRISYQFNMHSQLKLVLQYTDIDRDTSLYVYDDDVELEDREMSIERYFLTQLLYSYKINPQTLFFVGYSDGGLGMII